MAATLGAGSGIAGSLLAMETLHYLSAAAKPATVDTAIVLDLKTLALTKETVERDPACPLCGEGNGCHRPPPASPQRNLAEGTHTLSAGSVGLALLPLQRLG
jgi:hypothetical protein